MTPEHEKLAEQARGTLLHWADYTAAADIANDVINRVNEMVNAAVPNMATSLLARALILRGIHAVAAEWWADVVKLPTPALFAAIRSVADEPPPDFDTHTWIEERKG